MKKAKNSIQFNLGFTSEDSLQLAKAAKELGIPQREFIRRAMRQEFKSRLDLGSLEKVATS